MNLNDLSAGLNLEDVGKDIYGLISLLYPVCRSITGNGVRSTLEMIREYIPVEIHEIPSGTQVFDWVVPNEWNIKDAFIKGPDGRRIIDFQRCNLHVVSYSTPVMRRMRTEDLKKHLHSLPEQPDWIPYRTSYYMETWGFCISHNQLAELTEDEYEVCIDSTLAPGHLLYGEHLVPGDSTAEVLISCHVCHPSLCNDNLSGVALSVLLARHLGGLAHLKYSYRFLFIPGTIGSITWLCLNEARLSSIKHGLVLACLGDPGKSTYKRSRRGDAEIDRAVTHVLQHSGICEIMNFSPYGYDERQYCSPAFNLPVGCLMRTPHDRYPEYHTSADNLNLVRPEFLADSFAKCVAVLDLLENNRTYLNQNPKCEPRLGKRGLYRTIGGSSRENPDELALLWVLNQSDGNHSLLDIAEKSGCCFDAIKRAAQALLEVGLLKEISVGGTTASSSTALG